MTTAASTVTIRRATAADAPVCGAIFYNAFAEINRTHGFPLEVPSPETGAGILGMLFSHPGFYGIVAEIGGRIVGSNSLDERGIIAGLGPVSVDPGKQNSGVGRRLMEAALDRVRQRGFAGVRLLQSAFHTRSMALYSKLGFDVREPMAVMHGPPIRLHMDGFHVRPATTGDLDICNRICSTVHGHNRSGELLDAVNHGTARVVERGSRITGYASGFGYMGHVVAESTGDVQALLSAADRFEEPGIVVPVRNAALFRWCLDNGLRIILPMTLMSAGLYNEPAGAYMPAVLY